MTCWWSVVNIIFAVRNAKYLLYVVLLFFPFVQVFVVYIVCPFHEFCHIFVCLQSVRIGGILKLKQLENPE